MISYFASLKRLFASEFSNFLALKGTIICKQIFKFMIYFVILPFVFSGDEEHPEVDEG